MLAFLKKHLWEAVILAAVTGFGATWLKGFLTPWLPGPEITRCWVEEQWRSSIGDPPGPAEAHFTVLISRLHRDVEEVDTARLVGAFRGVRGFRPITTCWSITLTGADQLVAEQKAEVDADALRIGRGADLILWGEVAEKGNAVRVWMTGPTVRADLKAQPWAINKGVLEPAFTERFATALQAVALAALAPAEGQEGRPVAHLLRPLVPRLKHLLSDMPPGMDVDARINLLHAAARGFQAFGEQAGDTDSLLLAIEAYEKVLRYQVREHEPLDWAMTQDSLGLALWRLGLALRRLGGREDGTARLEEAVTAFRAALEERTRERVKLEWAQTQNNLGLALQALGEHESGTARLEEAISAFRAAQEEWTRERVPLDWARAQNNLGLAHWRLGERENRTARLEEAVTAFRTALKELTRERVPLHWAAVQDNLGLALQTLGERESGTARLEEAVIAYRAALEERTRERVPLDWASTRYNMSIVLALLAERGRNRAALEEAVACVRDAVTVFRENNITSYLPRTQQQLGRLEAALAAWPKP